MARERERERETSALQHGFNSEREIVVVVMNTFLLLLYHPALGTGIRPSLLIGSMRRKNVIAVNRVNTTIP